MFAQIDRFGRRFVAWPLVGLGWLLTSIARELILLGAFIADIEIPEEMKESE